MGGTQGARKGPVYLQVLVPVRGHSCRVLTTASEKTIESFDALGASLSFVLQNGPSMVNVCSRVPSVETLLIHSFQDRTYD